MLLNLMHIINCVGIVVFVCWLKSNKKHSLCIVSKIVHCFLPCLSFRETSNKKEIGQIKMKKKTTRDKNTYTFLSIFPDIILFFLTERSPVVGHALYVRIEILYFYETRFFSIWVGAQETNGYRMMKINSINTDYMTLFYGRLLNVRIITVETIRSIRRFSPENSQPTNQQTFVCLYLFVCMHAWRRVLDVVSIHRKCTEHMKMARQQQLCQCDANKADEFSVDAHVQAHNAAWKTA